MSNRASRNPTLISSVMIALAAGLGALVGKIGLLDHVFVIPIPAAPLLGAICGMLLAGVSILLGWLANSVRRRRGKPDNPDNNPPTADPELNGGRSAEPTAPVRDIPLPLIDNLSAATGTGPYLDTALAGATRLDICTGYVSASGLARLANWLDGMNPDARGRLLIGMAPQGWQYKGATAKAASYFLAQHLDYSPSTIPILQRLERHRQDGRLELRLRLTEPSRLHAKLYLWKRAADEGNGLMGSSNLTENGLGDQGELNVHVQRAEALRYLIAWFDARWQEPDSFAAPELLDTARQVVEDTRSRNGHGSRTHAGERRES